MLLIARLRLALLAASLLAVPALAENRVGAYSSTFEDRGPNGVVPIEMVTVAAKACAAKPCPLVIAMHGVTRNAIQTRDNWLDLAGTRGLIVVAPYLDSARFPTKLYQQGGVIGEPDRSKWLYTTIERLYDAMIADKRAEPGGYILFGHSAGAQFAHRMVLFMPDARYRVAITANAGFYTLPTGKGAAGGFSFRYSLDETPATQADVKTVFARPLRVMLGDQDIDPEHFQLNNTKGAKAQGPNRLTRGQFFFAAAKAEADRLKAPFNWTLTIVPGVDHDNTRMAKAAAELVFGKK